MPRERVDECYSQVENSDGMLVIGTSLEVYSAWRFVKRAVEKELPIIVLNQGETRLDRCHAEKIHLRIDCNSSTVLEEVSSILLT